MTLRFNLALRPAMRLRRRSSAANYAAGVFIRASQGVSTKKTTYRLGVLETIRYRLYNRRVSPTSETMHEGERMTLVDAMYAVWIVTVAPRSFEATESGAR
jgi:hypothetical protein